MLVIFWYFFYFLLNSMNYFASISIQNNIISNLASKKMEMRRIKKETKNTDIYEKKIKQSKPKKIKLSPIKKIKRIFNLCNKYIDTIFLLELLTKFYTFLKEIIKVILNSSLKNYFYICLIKIFILLLWFISLKKNNKKKEKFNQIFFPDMDKAVLSEEEKKYFTSTGNIELANQTREKWKNQYLKYKDNIPLPKLNKILV